MIIAYSVSFKSKPVVEMFVSDDSQTLYRINHCSLYPVK